jgi:Tol biopolymer transport system component
MPMEVMARRYRPAVSGSGHMAIGSQPKAEEQTMMRGRIAALGALCVLTGFSLTACNPGKPAAGTAKSGTASPTPAAAAAGAANVKPRNGLIAFMRSGAVGEYDIWVVRPDGTGLRRLTESPANRSDYNPAWSPDGSTLLFERRKLDPGAAGGDEALYAVNADGGGFRQITHCRGQCWSDGEATWSPGGGRRIAFDRATGPRSAPGPSLVAIDVANTDGSRVRQLSRPPHGYEDHLPTWSPDGRTIVFQRDTAGSGTPGPTKLMAVDAVTGTERVVYRLPSWAPGSGLAAFAPDGKRILFGFWCIYGDSCPPSSRAERNATLATIQPDGRGLRLLRLKSGADSGAWSPDGKRIVYRCRSGASPLSFRLCISNLNGTAFRRFPWPVGSAEPDWGMHP